MKSLKTNKIIVTLAIVLLIILGLTISSFADDNVQVINPSDVIGGNSNSGSSSSGAGSNSNANGSNTNANANSNRANNTNSNANRINNASNSSSYNNTNLPSTGLADHTPLFVIIGVLAVVAIIAYKKVNYYRGI